MSNYRIVKRPPPKQHLCDLPHVAGFEVGTVIQMECCSKLWELVMIRTGWSMEEPSWERVKSPGVYTKILQSQSVDLGQSEE